MTDAVQPPQRHAQVHAAVERAAAATGVDFNVLVETARRESAFNPEARARTSSATGLFQFIDGTWLDMVRRHGASHGLGLYANQIEQSGGRSIVRDPALRAEILALRTNPELAARMAGEFTRENANFLQARLGRAAQPSELYAAHVLGAGGAARLIEAANQGAPSAAALFPREAAANQGLFYANGAARSPQQLLERLSLNVGSSSAEISSDARRSVEPALRDAPLTPALAEVLFLSALLPLVAPDENHDQQRQSGLDAYARALRHNS